MRVEAKASERLLDEHTLNILKSSPELLSRLPRATQHAPALINGRRPQPMKPLARLLGRTQEQGDQVLGLARRSTRGGVQHTCIVCSSSFSRSSFSLVCSSTSPSWSRMGQVGMGAAAADCFGDETQL